MRTMFPLTRVDTLQKKSASVIWAVDEMMTSYADGWSISRVDPGRILTSFTSLWLRPGYALQAYQFKAGDSGNGIVWAMPLDAKLPEPADCERLTEQFLEPPKPHAALENFMDAFAGDGSAWSYLSASLLCRDLHEFGAIWHGCYWSAHEILGDNPWKTKRRPPSFGSADAWQWLGPQPEIWRPHVQFADDVVTVKFLTFTALGQESIVQHTDTFKAGHYRFSAATEALATGRDGYVF